MNGGDTGKRRASDAAGILQIIAGYFITIGRGLWHGLRSFGTWLGGLMQRSRAAAIILICALVIVIGGVVDTAVCWGKVYNGVKVGDVDLSGMSVEDAQTLLKQTYSARLNGSSVTVYASDAAMQSALDGASSSHLESSEGVSVQDAAAAQTSWTTDAQTLQARLDTASLAKEALEVGRSNGGILTRLNSAFFGYEITPSTQMNANAVETLAADIDETLGSPRVDYGITVTDGEATVTSGHDGYQIDRTWLTTQLDNEFLSADTDHAFVANISYAPLRIDQTDAQNCADTVNSALANNAQFTFNDASWTADAETIGSWVKTKIVAQGNGYVLQPYIDQATAKSDILQHLSANFDSADVHVDFVKTGSSVMVKTIATGTMPMVAEAIDKLNDVLFSSGTATQTPVIQVSGTSIPPSMSVQAAIDYGIISTISTYTTEYTANASARNHNIHLATALLNNSIVESGGGTWSFNDTAGECNAEKGFEGAGVIIDGETVDEIGGGICQVATTVFNAVYESGLPIIRRSNHSLYIASYPAGRDAAISWPDLDLIWENDTNSDVLVQTSYTDTSVTVNLLGVNPGYTVSTVTGDFVAGDKYSTKTVEDATLTSAESYTKQNGSDGRSITVTRTVKDKNGNVVRTGTFNSVYDAKDEIIVKGTKDSKSS